MINPTLAQAHLNKGEPYMVQKTPLISNMMDRGTPTKVDLNPQEQIRSQQLLTKVGQDADTAVIGNIAEQEGAMRTAQLADSQAKHTADQAISTMIYTMYGPNSATASFADPGETATRFRNVAQQGSIRDLMA